MIFEYLFYECGKDDAQELLTKNGQDGPRLMNLMSLLVSINIVWCAMTRCAKITLGFIGVWVLLWAAMLSACVQTAYAGDTYYTVDSGGRTLTATRKWLWTDSLVVRDRTGKTIAIIKPGSFSCSRIKSIICLTTLRGIPVPPATKS